MNIAHLLPYAASFPLKKHNGRYEWALRLAEQQTRGGHDVTIYAGPSQLQTALPNLHFRTLPGNSGDRRQNNAALFGLAAQDSTHDVLHSHFDSLHYELADTTDKPIIVTQHWFPTPQIAAAVPLSTRGNVVAVPVTHYMAAADARLGIPAADVIYHGIDLEAFAFSPAPRSDRLLFVGRIAPHKGVLETVRAAHEAGAKLDIVGKINPADQAYWQQIVPPVDGTDIRYVGAVPHQEVPALMSRAAALIFLPNQIEAFGQTIIEAQACGTPVILNVKGANPELLEDGVSGFLVSGPEACAEAFTAVSRLHPEDCRAFAERFSLPDMVLAYERLYERLLGTS